MTIKWRWVWVLFVGAVLVMSVFNIITALGRERDVVDPSLNLLVFVLSTTLAETSYRNWQFAKRVQTDLDEIVAMLDEARTPPR